MSDYTQATDFSAKDALPTGNVSKKILGSEVDAELALIATAIASKENSADLITTLADLFQIDSFTATLTGFASNPTGTVQYQYINGVVTLMSVATIQGTSNSTSMSMTGLPALITPDQTIEVACTVRDQSQRYPGAAQVNADGTIDFHRLSGSVLSTTNFTASNTKGLFSGWSITYPV